MSKIGIIRRSIREYGVHGAAVKAADRVLRRTPEEVPYERWQTKNRLSERDCRAEHFPLERIARQVRGPAVRLARFAVARGVDVLAAAKDKKVNLVHHVRDRRHVVRPGKDARRRPLRGEGVNAGGRHRWSAA